MGIAGQTTIMQPRFANVWFMQDIGDTDIFFPNFKQRLLDIYQQDWQAGVDSSVIFQSYKKYKTSP